jgi:hypothetical protein
MQLSRRLGTCAAALAVALFAAEAGSAQAAADTAEVLAEARALDPETGLGFDPFETTPEELLRTGQLTQLRHKLLSLRACAQAGAQSLGITLSSSEDQKKLAQAWMDAAFDSEQGAVAVIGDSRFWVEMRKTVLTWRFYCAATQTADARRDNDICYASCSLRLAGCEGNCTRWGPPVPGCLDHCDWAFNTCLFGCFFFF